MGLEISNFLTFPLTSSSICWWRNFFDKLQGLATIWRQSRQVSNFAYMKNRKVIPMPNFEQQIIWSDVKFEFRMISAFIWYTYCWYVTKNDQVLIFTYRSLHFVNVVKVVIGFNDITNVNNVNDVVTVKNIPMEIIIIIIISIPSTISMISIASMMSMSNANFSWSD